MGILVGPFFWARLLEIGLLNLLLSGDNAVVIGLAVRTLRRRQRLFVQIGGVLGALLFRLLFVEIVTALLRVPLLRLAGALLLVWIGVKLVQPGEEPEGGEHRGTSFWEAVWIIILADVTMSLDNVLAIAAAARGDMLLVGLGVASSLPFVVWGSGVLAALMNRHAWVIWLGGGILGYVAADMALGDPVVSARLGSLTHVLEHAVPFGVGAAVTMLGWWAARSHRRQPGAPTRSEAASGHPKARRRQ